MKIYLLFLLIVYSRADAVCDLATLRLELQQDLEDNNMLDCLREIPPPHGRSETEQERNLRLAAQWDTSCSFEANTTWFEALKTNYGITQLVDSTGSPVSSDFPDQADMCEVIRAAVAKNVFKIPNVDMSKIPKWIPDRIQCSSSKGNLYGPQICAATSGSFFNKNAWTIFNKSSVIKFDNKPVFAESEFASNNPQNSWMEENLPEAVNDLNLLSKDQLDNAGASLADTINNAVNPNNNATDPNESHEKSTSVHHYFKKIDTPITVDRDFRVLGEVSFVSEGEKIILGAYMASFNMQKYDFFCLKMSLNEYEVPSSRQCLSPFKKNSISGGFVERYTYTTTKIQILNQSGSEGKIISNGEDSNLSFGAVTLPDLGFYQHKVQNGILLTDTNGMFAPIQGFNISINNDSDQPASFMVLGNFSCKLPEASQFGTMIAVNGKEQLDTSFIRGRLDIVSISTATVVDLFPGNNSISMKYLYKGSKEVDINNSTQGTKYTQNLSAFRLPPGTKIDFYQPKGPINLTGGSWVGFGLSGKLEISEKVHLIILYHVNLKVNGKPFSTRLKVNGTKSFKSTLANVEGEEYAAVQGFLVKKLDPGSYIFDLEFLSNSNELFNPSSITVDKQTASLKIVQFPE